MKEAKRDAAGNHEMQGQRDNQGGDEAYAHSRQANQFLCKVR